jgi:hypothetical protein
MEKLGDGATLGTTELAQGAFLPFHRRDFVTRLPIIGTQNATTRNTT